MKNEVFREADELSLPVPQDTPAGTAVVVGSLLGVTATREGEGGNPDGYATVWMHGAYDLPVTTSTALTVGAPVYITSGGSLTPSSSGNTLFGYALEAKGTAPATITVKLAKV